MKYINAPISKKEIIFNEFIIDWSKPITLVEGPLDAVFGGDNAVCLLGSHLAHDSLILKKIVENNTKTYIALDADAPDKSEKISKMLSSFGIEVKEVKLPVGLDIADIGEKKLNELRLTSLCWTKESSILRKIYSMKSGSIL
jgi:xanthine/CO dehydrogenase XdhC/CoxF family maturation factor